MALPVAAEEVSAKTVVATVNGLDITLGHMIVARSTLPAQYLALPDDLLFAGILDQIVQQTALAEIGEAEISARDELVMENERRAYLAGAVLDVAAIAAVTDEALQAAYDTRFAAAEPGREYNAAHILIETELEAQAIKAEADGGADFEALAKARSTGPSGPNGGNLGWFGLGMMVKEFEDAVVKMEPGQVSAPVQTQFGWHVIKLLETRVAVTPEMAAVREELELEIQQKAVTDRIAEVTGAAVIVKTADGIDPSVIRKDELLND